MSVLMISRKANTVSFLLFAAGAFLLMAVLPAPTRYPILLTTIVFWAVTAQYDYLWRKTWFWSLIAVLSLANVITYMYVLQHLQRRHFDLIQAVIATLLSGALSIAAVILIRNLVAPAIRDA